MSNKILYVMVGNSGSGKTYFAKHHLIKGTGWYYVSRDEIRYSIIKDEEEYFSHEKEVYLEFIKRLTYGLKNDDIYYVIADATHLNWPSRNKLFNALSKAGNNLNKIDIIPVFINADLSLILKQNEQRDGRAKVDTTIIQNMNNSLTDPNTDPYQYTAIMYVNKKDIKYIEKPKFMYHKNDIQMKEITIKEALDIRK